MADEERELIERIMLQALLNLDAGIEVSDGEHTRFSRGRLGPLRRVQQADGGTLAPTSGLRSVALGVLADEPKTPVAVVTSQADWEGKSHDVIVVVPRAEESPVRAAFRRSEQRFRQLLDASPDPIAIVCGREVRYANPAALRITGHQGLDDVVGRSFVDFLHPDEAPQVPTDQQRQPENLELRVRRKDGSYVSAELLSLPIEWEREPARLVFGRDIEARRNLQEQLEQADRWAAVGMLAAGVAHEINNPLAYVLLNLEYLLRELPKAAGKAGRISTLIDRVEEAQHGVVRVGTIVRDLLDLSADEPLDDRTADLERVIGNAVKVADSHIAPRARFVQKVWNVPPVRADAARLEQVFINLLVNAAQAVPAGTPEDHEVAITARPAPEGRVVVEVTDTGAGIPPELISRVFDPFFTTKAASSGTGLGLPISHRIISSYGGAIRVESTVGRGTTFRVELLAAEDWEEPPPTQPLPAVRFTERRLRVLIVDDDVPVAVMLTRLLSDEHDTLMLTDPRAALERLVSRDEPDIDVVLCDLLMPDLSGMDLHEALRSLRPGFERRLVFMTGGAFTPRASEFLRSVPNPRLEKPFVLESVLALVRDVGQAD